PCQTCGLREFWGVSFLALDSSRRQIKDYGGSLLSELGNQNLPMSYFILTTSSNYLSINNSVRAKSQLLITIFVSNTEGNKAQNTRF
ncbi:MULTISPECIES: hypothetical protein, partial [Nostocales]|uniref:hypothetical protein n=1 Tax=Nostocales TaxID=1161 RepID=UPI001A7E7F92